MRSNPQTKKPVTIDLGRVGGSPGAPKNGIRQEEFERVLAKLLERPADRSEQDDRQKRRPLQLDVMPYRRHDTILVSARRGDGKTTFLADVLASVEQLQTKDVTLEELGLRERSSQSANLYSLGIIDPTLIENKQNIVIIIVQKIKAAADRALETTRSGADPLYEDFSRRLRELANGMTLLDGIGEASYGKDWADPDYILERGIDRADSAGGFERTFHRYVESACSFLRCDAFVLAIDDVDTSFDRGWPVLEALRKYLATPRLKVLMAGDIKLYNLLVRQQQWKHITPEFRAAEQSMPTDRSQLGQIVSMVDTLQDQYLVKIAAPENRVDLRTLLHTADVSGIRFVNSKVDTFEISDIEFVRRYAETLLAMDAPEDLKLLRRTLLKLPIRSVIQVLSGAWGLVTATTDGEDAPNMRASALDAFRHVVSTQLMNADLDENELREADPDRIFGVLSSWLTQKALWVRAARFHPEGLDDRQDLIALFVAVTLVDLARRSPGTTIDYWLRICTVREMVDRAELSQEALPELLDHLRSTTRQDMVQFASRLGSWDAEDGRQLSRGIRLSGASVPVGRLKEPEPAQYELYGKRGDDFRQLPFVAAGDKSERLSELPTLPAPLRGYHERLLNADWPYRTGKGSEAGLAVTYVNSLETMRNALQGQAAHIAMLPAFQVTSGQQSENGSYSILRLIAFVGDLLRLAEGKATARDVQATITRLSQLRSYPTPSAGQSADAEKEEDTGEEEGGSQPDEFETDRTQGSKTEDDDMTDEIRLLHAWVVSAAASRTAIPQAPVTLARIWTRFSYAFESIRDRLKHVRTRYLGVIMHRSIIAFLHAVGVEAMRSANRPLSPSIVNNPNESSINFLALLEAMMPEEEVVDERDPHLQLFFVLFSCPIWGYFLARNDSDIFGGGTSQTATAEVYERYTKFVAVKTDLPPKFPVRMRRTNPKAPKIAFEGLFDILNTVQLQGNLGKVKAPPRGRGAKPSVSTRSASKGSGRPAASEADERG